MQLRRKNHVNSKTSIWSVLFLLFDVLLICTIVWVDAHRSLVSVPEELKSRWSTIFRLLLVVPAFALIILTILILLVWQTEPQARFAHALLILSLWMPLTFMMFAITSAPLKTLSVLMPPVAVFILAGAPILLLTSIDHFHAVFDQVGYGLPFLIGLSVVAFTYVVIIDFNRRLSQSKPAPSRV
jgi:hypothetical protein